GRAEQLDEVLPVAERARVGDGEAEGGGLLDDGLGAGAGGRGGGDGPERDLDGERGHELRVLGHVRERRRADGEVELEHGLVLGVEEGGVVEVEVYGELLGGGAPA